MITTCGTDAVDFVRELGVDVVIDYKTQDVFEELNNFNRYISRMQCNWKEGDEIFYLMTHSTHFIYGYMASDIW